MRNSKFWIRWSLASCAVAALTVAALTVAASAGGLLAINNDDDGLLNVDVLGADVSVLPGGGSVADDLRVGGAGASVNTGGTETGVSLGGSSGDGGGGISAGVGTTSVTVQTGGSGNSGDGNGGNGGGNGGNSGSGDGGSGDGGGGNGANGGGGGVIVVKSNTDTDRDVRATNRLSDLERMIRSSNWKKAASLACKAQVEVISVRSWLERMDRAQLPMLISRNAMTIGNMQSAFMRDANLGCLLSASGVAANRVIALDRSGKRIVLVVI